MNWITLAFGIFALFYGLYTIYARLKTPDKFGKLEAMRQSYGHKAGTIVHTISYTLIPLVVGVLAHTVEATAVPDREGECEGGERRMCWHEQEVGRGVLRLTG